MSETSQPREGDADAVLVKPRSSERVDSGAAPIKAEYINNDYKPRLVAAYLPENAVEEIQQLISQREKSARDEQTGEPLAKKPKLKGRNRKRPMEKRPMDAEKLCPNIVGQRVCVFGDRCRFSHDIVKFMESRPKAIEGKCYVFETYGKCPFGITCMFSEQHVAADKEVSTSEPDVQNNKFQMPNCRVKNIVSKDMQIRLRKREYNFKRANKVIRQFQDKFGNKMHDKFGGKNDKKSNGQPVMSQVKSSIQDASDKSSDVKELSDGAACISNISEAVSSSGDWCVEADSKHDLLEIQNCEKPVDSVCKISADTNEALSSKPEIIESAELHNSPSGEKRIGFASDEDIIKPRGLEKKQIDLKNKLYLAPLTTVGNLPFRRTCKRLGADVTCGEMAMAPNLLQGQASEWALLKRHESETLFGVQLCASFPDSMTRAAQVINDTMEVDFIDVNLGCPIDLVVQKGEGCAVMGRVGRLEQIVYGMSSVMDVPLTIKMRTGLQEDKHIAHTLLPKLRDWGVSTVTIHGRSREQRYTKLADWNYIKTCVDVVKPMNVFGNGDILSYVDYNNALDLSGAAGCMLARGALIKPWLFTEIKEQRHWDISASERLDIVKEYVNYGLEHWGSDQQGVSNTRRFLLEWLSFCYRYIPVGILERVPQRINEKPPHYFGRNDLETLMASPNCADWIKISEMFLGPVPDGFTFLPKHRANAYQ